MTQQVCSTSGAYALQFGGGAIGSFMYGFTCTSQLATEVKKRHNFFSDLVYLDGQYPAVTNQYKFTLYYQAADREDFASFFMQLSLIYYEAYEDLKLIRTADNSVAIDFGICLMDGPPTMKSPDELLMSAAGIFTLDFIGNTLATVF